MSTTQGPSHGMRSGPTVAAVRLLPTWPRRRPPPCAPTSPSPSSRHASGVDIGHRGPGHGTCVQRRTEVLPEPTSRALAQPLLASGVRTPAAATWSAARPPGITHGLEASPPVDARSIYVMDFHRYTGPGGAERSRAPEQSLACHGPTKGTMRPDDLFSRILHVPVTRQHL
jgi:hypothetical protein